MVFASAVFLYYFLPLFLLVYYVCPRAWKSYWIAIASYVFYMWWRPDFVVLVWLSTVLDYCCALGIQRDRNANRNPVRWVWLSAVVELGLLAYFKYANFGVESANAILSDLGWKQIKWTAVVLPVGISFYTFKTLSYVVDVYRGDAKPVRHFGDFMCYVSMFPELVAGPIVRYNTVAEQLHSRTHTLSKFFRGVLFFQAGFAKKVLIADTLAPLADHAFAHAPHSTLDAWLGVLAYTFQIYFDFSGYSDMAIGLALMIGFRFPINFDQPYRATSVTDFWRRWHISLSTFLRDYLYVPLGGNRKGKLRTYVNLSLTMLLGGLWHGAAWTFILWGAYQGFWLVLERLAGKRSLLGITFKPTQIAFTFVLTMFGWVLFRAPNLPAAGAHFATMFGATTATGSTPMLEIRQLHWIIFAVAAAVMWLTPTTQQLVHRARHLWVVPLQLIFLLAIVHLHKQDNVPFLYFQF
jgi:alginate O-acetyltransferase complex protein AlgI